MKTKLSLLVVVFTSLQLAFAADPALSKLAAANNTFAFNLLKQLSKGHEQDNLFLSPYSAATALQMAAGGTAGVTKTEMEKALGTAGISPAEFAAATKAAAALLSSTDTNLILSTANALWYRPDSKVKQTFLEASQNDFAATIKPLDFRNTKAAEGEINQWASDQTHGRINDIANGAINPLYTDMVLANAIYFKGKWADPFEKNLTRDRPFHQADGGTMNRPMMEMSKKFIYRKGSGYQAVRLPYVGDDLAMYVFLPDSGSSPAKLLEIMNGDKWQRVTVPGFTRHEGHLILPRFKQENLLNLNSPLAALGMKTAFESKQADFSAMFGDPHHISDVIQKAFVEVNEEGTEAAAVTGIVMTSALEMPDSKPFEMICDRPFLFAIVDARSEMILFLGVVNQL